MNLESFEHEIARLHTQLQDAIAALAALKDIQATFNDMQPRYERLKQLTNEAAGLPEHYAKQFEIAREQAEARLAQLETQLRQQSAGWETTLAQHLAIHNEGLKQLTDEAAGLPEHYAKQFEIAREQAEARLAQLETQLRQQGTDWKSALSKLSTQQQQNQAHLQQGMEQLNGELQQAITTLNERVLLVNTGLRELMTNAMNKLEIKLRLEIKQRFNGTLWIGLLALVAALGTLAIVLFRK